MAPVDVAQDVAVRGVVQSQKVQMRLPAKVKVNTQTSYTPNLVVHERVNHVLAAQLFAKLTQKHKRKSKRLET